MLSLKQKYTQSIPSRFFLFKNAPLKPNGIWFHSCSLGEAKGIKPLIDRLPKSLLRVTTTTNTGFSEIKKYSENSRYLPFDLLLYIWLKPQKVLIVMEAEYWFLLFMLAKRKGAKTLLINARMNDKSYGKYLKIAWFYKHIFFFIDEVYAQTEQDKVRLKTLGAKNIKVIGNIKLYKIAKATKDLKKPNGLIVCGASTHKNEEELILSSFLTLKKENPKAKLILVPRHPDRFQSVVDLSTKIAKDNNLSFNQYSNNSSLDFDIIVVDMLGELINIYSISDIVILAGSFMPIGGHNAAEVAQFGCKIISGKEYFNQKDIYQAIKNIKVVRNDMLTKTLLNHHKIQNSKIISSTDIEPILNSIQNSI